LLPAQSANRKIASLVDLNHLRMIILGYSGFDGSVDYQKRRADLRPGEERMTQGLDSAAALVIDGRIVAAAAEERFSFQKHSNRFPALAIQYCLDEAGVALRDVDHVAHGFDYGRYAAMFKRFDADFYGSVLAPERQLPLWSERLGYALPAERFHPVNHHLAHAATAFLPSGFDEALCVVCDGMGEVASLTVYYADRRGYRTLDTTSVRNSVGILYSIVTRHLGFKFNADEYKVMGLAPYGDPSVYRGFFESITQLKPDGRFEIDLPAASGAGKDAPELFHRGVLRHLHECVIPSPESSESLSQPYCDFAAAAQECLERILFHTIRHWRSVTGLKNLCMAGGVALNCTCNGKLVAARWFDQVYVQPAAGDDGAALGAALHVAVENRETFDPRNVDEMPFYGPSYSKAKILAAARTFSNAIDVDDAGSISAAADDAAAALCRDEIVAWFQGRMEYGPRALGNRSILANPTVPDIKERLNQIIKLREGFRPFAPAVNVEHARTYFDFVDSFTFDYMLATCQVKPDWRGRLPGVTHVDGSARMQTVARGNNPSFHDLIRRFGERSGIYCVINTSFNVRGQPMIVSPQVAIETFLKVRIDRLYLDSIRITKRGA
jgi:carbamoyltransferase